MAQPPTRPRRPSTSSRSSSGRTKLDRSDRADRPDRLDRSSSGRAHLGRAATVRPTSASWTPSARRRNRWRLLARAFELAIVAAAVGLTILWLSIPDVRPLETRDPPTTAFIELRRSQAAAGGKPFRLQWTWKPIGRISPHLRRAVVISEDWNFWSHEGVDWKAVEQVVDRAIEKGELSRGGSTITQQLAKNLYLSPQRSLVRKLREMLIAFRLENELSKERILEIYLNVVELGDGIFGAEAAARRYYKRSAADLTPVQAARLAVALPNPFERSPADRSAALDRKAGRILRIMRASGSIGDAELRSGLVSLGLAVEEEDDVPAKPAEGAPTPTTPRDTTEDEPAAAPDPRAPAAEPAPATAPEAEPPAPPAPEALPMPPEEGTPGSAPPP